MPGGFKYSGVRNSHQSLNEVYFWTSVIKDWKHLLKEDEMKMIIMESFQWLVKHELVYVYGYVVMPNHIYVFCHGQTGMGTIKDEWQKDTKRKLRKIHRSYIFKKTENEWAKFT